MRGAGAGLGPQVRGPGSGTSLPARPAAQLARPGRPAPQLAAIKGRAASSALAHGGRNPWPRGTESAAAFRGPGSRRARAGRGSGARTCTSERGNARVPARRAAPLPGLPRPRRSGGAGPEGGRAARGRSLWKGEAAPGRSPPGRLQPRCAPPPPGAPGEGTGGCPGAGVTQGDRARTRATETRADTRARTRPACGNPGAGR